MRLRVAISSLLFLSTFQLPASGQQSPTTASQSPQRDPQALSIVNQALNASGGVSAITAVQDFTAFGNITYFWGGEQVQGALTVRGKGFRQFRMDASVSGGTQSLVINGDAGAFTRPNGQKIPLPSWNAAAEGNLMFPANRIASALTDPTTTVVYLGLVTWNGSQVHQVHVAPIVDPALNPNHFSGVGAFDLYIDPASHHVQGLSETMWWIGNFSQAYQHELTFSNYTPTNGLLLPFAVTEKLGGQQTWTLQLGTVSFNTGLTDANFQL